MAWETISENNLVNVIPLNDIREHEESAKCSCGPRVEEDGRLIIHHAWDQRELAEQADSLAEKIGPN